MSEIKSSKTNQTDNNAYNLIEHLIAQRLRHINTFKLCRVVAVNDDKTLNVINLIPEINADGKIVEPVIWKDFPILQTQGSKAAFRIEYAVDDIVLCGFCDRDIYAVKRNGKKQAAPITPQITPLTAGIVLGAVLFDEAEKYIKITDEGIEIKGNVFIDGSLSVSGGISSTGKMEAGNGASGTFADSGQGASMKTLTIEKGIITNIT